MAKAAETSDFIERLKLIVTMYLAGHHIQPERMQLRALLNPVLGETIQAYLSDGTKCYCEQTCHHPPISNFHFIGPDEKWEFNGYTEYGGYLSGLNTLNGTRIGKAVLKFHDGGLITIKEPIAEIAGLLKGEKVYNYVGKMIVKDYINKITVEVCYNPS